MNINEAHRLLVRDEHIFHIHSEEEDDAVVASVHVTKRHGVYWVHDLHVLPDYRNMGLARKLMRHALEEYDYVDLYLNVWSGAGEISDEDLIEFYTECGFQPTPTPGCMMKPKTAIGLVKLVDGGTLEPLSYEINDD